ncbi:MAG: hypothetical protein COA69_12480 [Robiginitomaculum sp.]|nr:MAG: hypothetical protein COA69_12480 [Robiginitomaculum sp.]
MPKSKKQDKDYSKPYERPSQRMFRRSRAAEMRRRQAARKEDRFMRLIFGVAGFGMLLAFLFFYMFTETAQAAQSTPSTGETSAENAMTEAFLGNFSILDLGGIAFVAIAGYAVWRRYSNKG